MALFACMGIASCSQDELADTQGNLPQGKYPIELTGAGLQAVATPAYSTRGTVDNDWDGVNTVAVQVDGKVKSYKVTYTNNNVRLALLSAADGETPFYWQSATERVNITAWHPYSTAYPTSWTVKADQNSVDEATGITGYQASDLIKGELKLAFEDRDDKTMNAVIFEHQTAKVEINLSATEGVQLNDAKVKLLGVEGVDGGNEITPFQPIPGEWTYLALLNGQDIAVGENFIQVTVDNGNSYYYKPTEAKKLQGGYVYTYNITVKNDGIEVTAGEGGQWNDSGNSENISSYTSYTKDDLKIGDYYYSDGSRADGGLRKVYSDGTMEWENVTPESKEGEHVIGIVFYVGHHEKDDSDYFETGIRSAKCNGYVLALHDANGGNDCRWGPRGTLVEPNMNRDPEGFCGYKNTQAIIGLYGEASLQQNFPAAYYATVDYGTREDGKSPDNSSGWFLPSAGQCQHWLDNRAFLLHQVQQVLGEGNYNDWELSYWSSSERDVDPSSNVWYLYFRSNHIDWVFKDGYGYVRSCLAF